MNGSTAVPVPMLTQYINGSIIGPGASTENPLGYAIITSVPSAGRLDVDTVTNFGPTTGANPISLNGRVWGLRSPILVNNDPSTYPRVCGFYQSRLWFAGSNKYSMIVFGSKVNVINDFDVGTGQPFDGVAEFLSDTEDGPISDIGFGLNLNLWTNTTQFTVPSGLDVGITAGSFRVRNTSSYGINQAHPTKYRDSLYYVRHLVSSLLNYWNRLKLSNLLMSLIPLGILFVTLVILVMYTLKGMALYLAILTLLCIFVIVRPR